jgi:hypothetical protein
MIFSTVGRIYTYDKRVRDVVVALEAGRSRLGGAPGPGAARGGIEDQPNKLPRPSGSGSLRTPATALARGSDRKLDS